ncbi:DUF3768 domain-containing protein [Endozoicomonas sp. SCSIO W0465]|uniref:DUF3768 domain-containing protein n=1 Tax=Endozoicomonas sp. SCSIO W0465 TaxID=2918516 RepID=UPI002074F2D0|nr:DUF3768 domain-containing protein [Endozoicomonas sp. SCSIO W0465]USE38039.1 DUF3768 domain-containing protein [Endozoicomonas sp. SCSIO W0465]
MKSIAIYNDRVRRSLIDPEEKEKLESEGCLYIVMMTANLTHTIKDKIGLATAIANFDNFHEDNDPYGEHDWLSLDFDNEKIFIKFDYYDRELEHGSENPEDLSKTIRVLTVMLAIDY